MTRPSDQTQQKQRNLSWKILVSSSIKSPTRKTNPKLSQLSSLMTKCYVKLANWKFVSWWMIDKYPVWVNVNVAARSFYNWPKVSDADFSPVFNLYISTSKYLVRNCLTKLKTSCLIWKSDRHEWIRKNKRVISHQTVWLFCLVQSFRWKMVHSLCIGYHLKSFASDHIVIENTCEPFV